MSSDIEERHVEGVSHTTTVAAGGGRGMSMPRGRYQWDWTVESAVTARGSRGNARTTNSLFAWSTRRCRRYVRVDSGIPASELQAKPAVWPKVAYNQNYITSGSFRHFRNFKLMLVCVENKIQTDQRNKYQVKSDMKRKSKHHPTHTSMDRYII
jgi:hypothetical protein